MRAVILAAAVLAAASIWLVTEDDSREPSVSLAGRAGADLAAVYRADAAECRNEAAGTRQVCQRRARDRVLTTLRQEAGRLSLR